MKRIPLEDFFRKPERMSVKLAPSGDAVAFLAPYERRMNVFVRELAGGETTRVTSATERDIAGYTWVSDKRLAYLQDTGGDENYRLYLVGRDGSNTIDVTPYDNVKCGIVDDLEDDERHILFQMNRRDPQVFDVFRLDVVSGESEVVAENPGNVQSWITDNAGRLRLATTTDGVNTSILYRPAETADWRTVATFDFKQTARPLYFTFDDRRIYVSSNVDRDRAALYEYDPETGRHGRLIHEHDEVDVYELLRSKARKTITGVVFETDRVEYAFFDETRRRIQAFVDEKLPERENHLVSHDRAEGRFVVYSASDRTRGSYHLLRTDPLELEKLFDLSPWLDETEMAPMESIRLRSRDGLTLHGYLTRPPGAGSEPLPLIVNPHGGPWHRDSWGFNPEVQFLANRGYGVMQVNFRGSTGYGRRFLEASFGQWGLSMQDDVTDAVQWAVEQGIADPSRIAIFGGSYGGYAALSGLTRTPEVYACGVSYVGVSNLFTWISAFPPYWKPYLEMIHEMVGHPERDADRFRETSPYFNADRIRVPLLVAQGANDPRVRKEESDQIVAALRERGVPVEYLVKDDEGHGFSNEENTFEFYRALERFLARHLDGAVGSVEQG